MRPLGFLSGIVIVVCLLLAHTGFADENYQPPQIKKGEGRYLAVVSDLHMGLGKVNEKWHPYEDFRWPKAFRALLDEISNRGKNKVDLVIAGDFLELWQIPDDVPCRGDGPDLGCSITEMIEIVGRVVTNHMETIEDLVGFSQKGENRIHIIPGNHDAALMLSPVWEVLRKPLQAEKGRIEWVSSGTWISHDGRVVIEHGHQIPGDANRFDTWPQVADEQKKLLYRPGGELLVQKIFNNVERGNPVIDNLSPEIEGIWNHLQDSGFWGSTADLAHLSIFYIFETSLSQKTRYLGKEEFEKQAVEGKWNVSYARENLGGRLVAYAMPKSALKTALLSETLDDPRISKLLEEFNQYIADPNRATDDAILQLCDLAWTTSQEPCLERNKMGHLSTSLSGVRPWLLGRYLESRRKEFPRMNHFIYGHTHELKKGYPVLISDEVRVFVYNSGAFQRLMDMGEYKRRLAEISSRPDSQEKTKELTLDDFPSCYTVVLAPFEDGFYRPETKRWFMKEDQNKGKILEDNEVNLFCR